MTADDAFNEFYQTEGIRFFEDLTHRGFMRHAFLHGWAAARAHQEEMNDGERYSQEALKAVALYNSKRAQVGWGK
jgi:hypothetical protein